MELITDEQIEEALLLLERIKQTDKREYDKILEKHPILKKYLKTDEAEPDPIEKAERDREDPGFYNGDPDAGRSEADLQAELEAEDNPYGY